MKPSHSFLYISSKVWLNALLVFRLALCFASDDPRTSCLFTNTAHLIRYVLTCRHTLLYKDLFSLITHLKPVGGGGIPGNLWWGCAARLSKSWSYFRPKKVIFHTRRQTCRKQKLCYHYLDWNASKKISFEFAYCSFLLIYLELKWQTHSYTPVLPRKPYPIPDQNRQYLNYRKIPKISAGAYIFQRPILRGLFLEGLI